jgi:hypothetical protein
MDIVLKHPVAVIYSSQTVPPSTMQVIEKEKEKIKKLHCGQRYNL